MPVSVSGSAEGAMTSRMTSHRDPPRAWAASMSARGAAATAAVVDTATGGKAAMASSVTLGSSLMPSQMISSEKYASGGSVRRKVIQGSNSERTQPTVPMSSPKTTPAAMPMPPPIAIRRRLMARCSMRYLPL